MSQDKFQILFDRSSDPHIIFDATGITDCNDAMIRLLGAPDKSRVLSLHPAALSPAPHPRRVPFRRKEVAYKGLPELEMPSCRTPAQQCQPLLLVTHHIPELFSNQGGIVQIMLLDH